MIAGGFCNGNPNHPDCYQLRLDSTMFYDFESGQFQQIFKNIQKKSIFYAGTLQT